MAVRYRHDSRAQTAHVLTRYNWQGNLADRVTGYHGRNDQMNRERVDGQTYRELAESWRLRARSSAWRAVKEAKARAVAVLEAMSAKLKREPLAAAEFAVLRTDRDTTKREPFIAEGEEPMTPGEAWFRRGNVWTNGWYRLERMGTNLGTVNPVAP